MLRQSERKSEVYCNLGSVYYGVACNPDAAVIFHTPRACSHLAQSGFWGMRRRAYLRDPQLQISSRNHLFVTNISEKEAIFGGEKLLKECLQDVTSLSWVRYVVVTPGCTAGVIGDDTESACKEAEECSGKPVLFIPGAGFMSGHYIDTQIALLRTLFHRFAPSHTKKTDRKKTAVILGENRGVGNEYHFLEMQRLLSYFGFEKVLFPPNAMTVDDFASIADADLIMPISINHNHFRHFCDYTDELGEQYSASVYKGNTPLGLSGTLQFLENMGTLLGEKDKATKAMDAEKKRFQKLLDEKYTPLRGKHFVYVVGFPARFFTVSIHPEILLAAGMILDAIIFHNDLTAEEKEAHRPLLEAYQVPILDGEDHVQSYDGKTDMVLTTTLLPGIPHQVALSVHTIGTWGAENTLNKCEEALTTGGRRIIYEY